MTIERNADVEASAFDLLLEQFKTADLLKTLIGILVAPAQVLEDLAQTMREQLTLSTATNAALRLLGRIAGRSAIYPNDDALRSGIYIQIAINASQGTPEHLLPIVKSRSGADKCYYQRHPPATCLIFCYLLTSWSDLATIQQAAIAGERLVITGTQEEIPFVVGLDVDELGQTQGSIDSFGSGESANTGGGFAELGYSEDGAIVEIYAA